MKSKYASSQVANAILVQLGLIKVREHNLCDCIGQFDLGSGETFSLIGAFNYFSIILLGATKTSQKFKRPQIIL